MDSSNSFSSIEPVLKKVVIDGAASGALDGIQSYESGKELLPMEVIKQILSFCPIDSTIKKGKARMLDSIPSAGKFLVYLDTIAATLSSADPSKLQEVLAKLSNTELDAIAQLIPPELPFASNLKKFIKSGGNLSSDQEKDSLLQFKAFLLAGILMGSGKISEGSEIIKKYVEKMKDYGKGVLSGEVEPIPVSILVYLNQILENENSSSAIRKSSEYLFNLGRKVNRLVMSLADKTNPNNLLPLMIKGGEMVYKGMKTVEKDFVETVGNSTAHTFLKSIHNAVGLTGTFNKILNCVLKNSKIFEECLQKINVTFTALTPAKVMGCMFVSLNKFSQLTHEANQNEDIHEKDQLKYELFHAGYKKMLPSAGSNEAFHLICNPRDYAIGMRKNYIHQLNQGFDQGTGHFAREVEKDFFAFCHQKGLDKTPPDSLELVKAAFMADKLCPVSREGPKFLAKMILLDPLKYANTEELDVEKLIQEAAVLSIKKSLAPTIVDKFFPDSLKILIGAANRIKGGEDIYDKIYTAIATVILQNGMSILSDPGALAQSILPLMGIDTTCFSNKIVGDGSPENIEKLFKQLMTNIDTPEFANSLHAITLHPNENLKIANKTTIQECVDSQKDNSPVPTHALNSMGSVFESISKRKDWALFLMFAAREVDIGLQKPEDVQPIDITKRSTITALKDILQALYPSTELKAISHMAKVLHFAFQSRIKGVQTQLKKLSFFDHIPEVKANLLKLNLTDRFIHSPEFQNISTPGKDHMAIRAGISAGFDLHLKNAVQKIWGIDSSDPLASKYTTEYMEYLASQDSSELVKIVAQVEADPKEIRAMFIKKYESELKNCQSHIDQVLLDPLQLPTIPNKEFIENALTELHMIEIPTDEMRKGMEKLSRLKEIIDLHSQTKTICNSLLVINKAHLIKSGESRTTDEETLAVYEKTLPKIEEEINHAEITLKKLVKSKADQGTIKKASGEIERLKMKYETNKKNLKVAKEEIGVKKLRWDSRRSILNANHVFSELREEKIKLFELLSAPIRDGGAEISKVRENILKLEEKIRFKFAALSEKEKSLNIARGIDPDLMEKLNYLEKLADLAVLRNDPRKNKKEIDRCSKEIDHSYERILNFNFKMGLGETGLHEKIDQLNRLKNSLVLEIESNKKHKYSETIQFYSEKRKKMELELFEEEQRNDALTQDIKQYGYSLELSKKKVDLQKRLDVIEVEKREYIQKKEGSISRLGRAYQYWRSWKNNDATLKGLDAKMDSIIAERNLLEDEYRIKGYDEHSPDYSDLLSQTYHERSLDIIKEKNLIRVAQFKEKKNHLQRAIQSLREEEKKFLNEEGIFYSNEELGDQLKQVETELRCLQHLQKNVERETLTPIVKARNTKMPSSTNPRAISPTTHSQEKTHRDQSSIKNRFRNFGLRFHKKGIET